MKKRRYPLFVIDTTRAHGRELETDYLCCTSAELPFVAEITYITEAQYQKEYNRENQTVIYSDGADFRIRMEVVQITESYDAAQLRALMARGLKEIIKHRNAARCLHVPHSTARKLAFLDEMIRQGWEQKRQQPENDVIDMSLDVLNDIRRDYDESK